MVKQDFFIELPSGMEMDDIHPDHLALSAFSRSAPVDQEKFSLPKAD